MITKKRLIILIFVIIGLMFFNIALIIFFTTDSSKKDSQITLTEKSSTQGVSVHYDSHLEKLLAQASDSLKKDGNISDSVSVYQLGRDENISRHFIDYKPDTAVVRSDLRVPIPQKNLRLTLGIIYKIYPTPDNDKLLELVRNISYASGKSILSLDPRMIRPTIVSNHINNLSNSDSLLFKHLQLDKFNFKAEVLSIKIEELN